MSSGLLAPNDNPLLDINIRLWDDDIYAFLHPRYRKQVGFHHGTPLFVQLAGVTFQCVVIFNVEFYAISLTIETPRTRIELPDGDYDGLARVDWDLAIPENVAEALRQSGDLLEVWRSQSVETIREQINRVLRVLKPANRLARELELIQQLKVLAKKEQDL